MVRKHPHSPVAKGIEDRIRQHFSAKRALHVGMHENIYRARKP